MNLPRVIPSLLLKGEGLVKTVNFKNPIYVGDPINAVRIFNEKEVDELVIFDIDASQGKNQIKFNWIKDIVSESFMPIGYAGGIDNIEQIKKLFDLGIEKIIVNTRMFDFDLIHQASIIYGSQSIVACIDSRKSLFGGYLVYTKSGTIKHKVSPDDLAKKLVESGVGEIIIQSIDREGAMKGFDIDLIKLVSSSVRVPVVASGGAGSLEHLKEAILLGGASAVSAGSLFVYKGKHKAVLINYPERRLLENLFKK